MVYTVERSVQSGEWFAGIDKLLPSVRYNSVFKANHSDLADARRIWIRRFDIYRKKTAWR
jgi:hypothetical protein